MVNVSIFPKKTGMVSCPINLSLCISKISDIAERIKTIPNVKQKATIKPALKELFLSRAGKIAATIPQATDIDIFFEPGKSFKLRKCHFFGRILIL